MSVASLPSLVYDNDSQATSNDLNDPLDLNSLSETVGKTAESHFVSSLYTVGAVNNRPCQSNHPQILTARSRVSTIEKDKFLLEGYAAEVRPFIPPLFIFPNTPKHVFLAPVQNTTDRTRTPCFDPND